MNFLRLTPLVAGLSIVVSLVACSESDSSMTSDAASASDALPEAAAGDGLGSPTFDGGSTGVDGADAPATNGLADAAAAESGAGPVAPNAGPPVGLDKLSADLGAALCAKIYQCCGDNEIRTLFGPRLKMTNCPALLPIALTPALGDLTYSLTEDHVTYRGDLVPTCLAAFASRSCADFAKALAAGNPYNGYSSQPAPLSLNLFECPQMIAPKQLPGQLCAATYECIDSFCKGNDIGDMRCRTRSRENEVCSADVDCATGLICASNACHHRGAVGESCSYYYDRGFCQDGLYCAADPMTSARTCQVRLDDGATCPLGSSEACKSGYCNYEYPATGTPVGRCMAVPPTTLPPQVLRCSGR